MVVTLVILSIVFVYLIYSYGPGSIVIKGPTSDGGSLYVLFKNFISKNMSYELGEYIEAYM